MEEEDPLDAYMKKIEVDIFSVGQLQAETKADLEESSRRDRENMQRYFDEEEAKAKEKEEKENQNQAPVPTITLDDIMYLFFQQTSDQKI